MTCHHIIELAGRISSFRHNGCELRCVPAWPVGTGSMNARRRFNLSLTPSISCFMPDTSSLTICRSDSTVSSLYAVEEVILTADRLWIDVWEPTWSTVWKEPSWPVVSALELERAVLCLVLEEPCADRDERADL